MIVLMPVRSGLHHHLIGGFMNMEEIHSFYHFVIGSTWLTIGLWAGVKLANYRWKLNADQIQRIECDGKLYKVNHDEVTEYE